MNTISTSWVRRQLLWTYFQMAVRNKSRKGKPNWILAYLYMCGLIFCPLAFSVLFLVDWFAFSGNVRTLLTSFYYFRYRGDVNGAVVFMGAIPGLILGYFVCCFKVNTDSLMATFYEASGVVEWIKVICIAFSVFFAFLLLLIIVRFMS